MSVDETVVGLADRLWVIRRIARSVKQSVSDGVIDQSGHLDSLATAVATAVGARDWMSARFGLLRACEIGELPGLAAQAEIYRTEISTAIDRIGSSVRVSEVEYAILERPESHSEVTIQRVVENIDVDAEEAQSLLDTARITALLPRTKGGVYLLPNEVGGSLKTIWETLRDLDDAGLLPDSLRHKMPRPHRYARAIYRSASRETIASLSPGD